MIVAMSENRCIGRAGALPWRLPDDLKRFRQLTTGHTIIMGRKSHESIGRALPERKNIVVTRSQDWQPAAGGIVVARSIDEALRFASGDSEAFIIGGAEIYAQTLDRVERLYLTLVHAQVKGDTYLPEMDLAHRRKIDEQHHPADGRHEFAFTFTVYDRA